MSAHAQIEIQTVALTGDATPDGDRFNQFAVFDFPPPQIADGPVSLFPATLLTPGGGSGAPGMYGGSTGQLAKLFRAGEPAPGAGGAVFHANRMVEMAQTAQMNDNGIVALRGWLSGGDVVQNDELGIWTGAPGGLQLLARSRDLVPGRGEERFASFDPPGLSGSGAVVFRSGTTVAFRLFAGSALGNLRLIASNGDPAPITIPGRDDALTLQVFGNQATDDGNRINHSGQVAFAAGISGFSVATGSGGIFFSGAGGVQVLAHNAQNRFNSSAPLSPGSEAPGTGERGRFTTIANFALNNAGQVAFVSGFTSFERGGSGIWIGTPGNLQLIARSGNSAGVAGATFDQFNADLSNHFLNDSGEVVFQADLSRADQSTIQGLFRGSAGQTTPIVYQGQPAGGGWTFEGVGNATINNAGDVAFTAVLKDEAGITADSVWIADAQNRLTLVARVGALFQVRPGDERTVHSIAASRIDEDGQVVLRLEFSTGTSGIFIAGLPPIVGADFYWAGPNATNDNWHTSQPRTNWEDSFGVTTTIPGLAGTERVFIEGADVRIEDASAEIGTLTATGRLTVRNQLIVNGAANLDALVLDSAQSKLVAFGALRLDGDSRWEAGAIQLTGNTLVNSKSFTLTNNAHDYQLSGTIENRGEADFIVRGALTAAGRIVNHGTFALSDRGRLQPAEAGSLVFENHGNVEVILSGEDRVRDFDFTFHSVEDGASLLLDGAKVNLNQPGTLRGRIVTNSLPDQLTIRASQTMAGGEFAGVGLFDLRAELNLSGRDVTTESSTRFEINSGARLSGAAQFINLGYLDWKGGEIAGIVQHQGQWMQIGPTTDSVELHGGQLINEESIRQVDLLGVRDGGRILNKPGSEYLLKGRIAHLSGARGSIEFDNATLRAGADVFGTQLQIDLQLRLNNGSSLLTSSPLSLHGGGESSGGGLIEIVLGPLDLYAGDAPLPYNFSGSYRITGSRPLTIHPGASIHVPDGELTIDTERVSISGDVRGDEGVKITIASDGEWKTGMLANVDWLKGRALYPAISVGSGGDKQIHGTVFFDTKVDQNSVEPLQIVGELQVADILQGWTVHGPAGFTGAGGRIVNKGRFAIATPEPIVFSGLTFDNRAFFVVDENARVEFGPGVLLQLEETNGVSHLSADRFHSFHVKNGGRLTLGPAPLVASKAELHLEGSGSITNITGSFTNEGKLELTNQAQFVVPGDFASRGVLKIEFGSALIASSVSITGFSTLIAGEIFAGTVTFPESRWGGTGKINGNVFNGGSGSPGNSPGTFTIVGDYTQLPSGNLRIELASPAASDLLAVSGQVALDGTLTVARLGGYVPSPADRFTILESGQPIIGSFWNVFGGRVMAADRSGTFSVTLTNGGTSVELGDFRPGDVIDTDGDGMSDEFEQRHFGNPTAADPEADNDGDGALNREEYLAGTNPRDASSSPSRGELLNISTRMRVGSGEKALIGGFIITGSEPKNVIVRAIGPSLVASGLPDALLDPTLELFNGAGEPIASNNDWRDSQQSEIEASTIPPSDDREAAIVATLAPGNYTAVLRGSVDTIGVALVEVYDLAQGVPARLANISSRGFVETGDNVMIGGIIVGGAESDTTRVIVRAIGPSLTAAGVEGALLDPTLQLVDANGSAIVENDDWPLGQAADLEFVGIHPTDDAEAAVLAALPAGNYTAIVRGTNDTTGVALIEFYRLP